MKKGGTWSKATREKLRISLKASWGHRTEFGSKLQGKRFGKMLIIQTPKKDHDNYELLCDCGYVSVISLPRIKTGITSGLFEKGCRDCRMKDLRENLVGMTKNFLTVINLVGRSKLRVRCVLCSQVKKLDLPTLRQWMKKRNPGCRDCGRRKCGKVGRRIVIIGDARTVSGWGMYLGLTRQRVAMLEVDGKLESRVKEFAAAYGPR